MAASNFNKSVASELSTLKPTPRGLLSVQICSWPCALLLNPDTNAGLLCMQPIIIQSLSEIENAVLLVLFYTYHLVDNKKILGFDSEKSACVVLLHT